MNTGDVSSSDFSLTLRRQIRTIIYVSGPLLAIFAGIAFGLPDIYRSTGVFRIEQSINADNRAEDRYAEYYVETLTGQVFTPENLKKWTTDFDLYTDETGWVLSDKIAELRDNLDTTIIMTPVIDPVAGRQRDVVTGFEVSYNSQSSGTAQSVAAAVADAFLVENRRSRQARGESEIDFFKNESEVYRVKIAEVEERLAAFKERNSRRLPEMMQVNMSAMDRVERDLETTQLQIDNLRRQRVILQAQLNQIPTTSDESIRQLAALQNEYVRVSSIYQDTHPTVVSIRKQIDLLSQSVDSTAAIPILRQQLDKISTELVAAREKYSDDHPDVRQLVRSENALADRIAALASGSRTGTNEVGPTNDLYVELDTQIKSIDTQVSGLNVRSRELRSKRNEYEQALMETPQVEREYQELSRDLSNARKLFDETQEKQREAELSLGLTKGARGEQLVLAQAPFVPGSAAWPPRAAILVLGVILAAGLGIGIGTLRELSSSSVRSSRDVFEICGMPPIALIPEIHNRAGRIRKRLHSTSFVAGVGVIGALAFFLAHAS